MICEDCNGRGSYGVMGADNMDVDELACEECDGTGVVEGRVIEMKINNLRMSITGDNGDEQYVVMYDDETRRLDVDGMPLYPRVLTILGALQKLVELFNRPVGPASLIEKKAKEIENAVQEQG